MELRAFHQTDSHWHFILISRIALFSIRTTRWRMSDTLESFSILQELAFYCIFLSAKLVKWSENSSGHQFQFDSYWRCPSRSGWHWWCLSTEKFKSMFRVLRNRLRRTRGFSSRSWYFARCSCPGHYLCRWQSDFPPEGRREPGWAGFVIWVCCGADAPPHAIRMSPRTNWF